MKKFLLTAAIAALGVFGAQAQGFKAGLNVGLPIGDAGDAASLQLGADLAYTWELSESFELGVTTGYVHFLGEEQTISEGGFEITAEAQDFGFVPVAATAKFSFGEDDMLFVGGDLGYAIYVGDGEGESGFLYQPKVGWQNDMLELYAFYKAISIGSESSSSTSGDVTVTVTTPSETFSTVGVGAAFKF